MNARYNRKMLGWSAWVTMAAVLVAAPRVHATEVTNYWIGGTGNFSVNGNWDTNLYPNTTDDHAIFNTNAEHTVTFTENITNYRAWVTGGTSSDFTWNLGGFDYNLTSVYSTGNTQGNQSLLLGMNDGAGKLTVTNGNLYTRGFGLARISHNVPAAAAAGH